MKIKLKTKKLAIIIAIVCAVVILLSLIFVPMLKTNTAALKSRNFKITTDMMSYLVKEELDNYIDYHTSSVGDNYLDIVKLDKDKNLRNQKSVYGGSWFDYFYDLASKRAKEILLTCEEAKKSNISLTDDEKKEIKELASEIKGVDISKSNLKKILEYEKLSQKYKNHLQSSITEAEYEKYYNNNRNKFDCVDYKRVIVNINVDQNVTNSDAIESLTKAALKKVEALKDAISKEGFDVAVSKYLKEIGSQETIEDLTFVSQRYVKDVQYSEWAFAAERKVGDIVSFEGKNQYSIYYLAKTPYPYDYTLNDGVIAYGKYDLSKPTAMTELRIKLDELKNDKDLMKFIDKNGFKALDSSKLYKSDLPDIVMKWFYDENRKSGEIQTCEYGKYVYIMKYNGVGESYFKTELTTYYMQELYDAKLKELSKEINLKASDNFKFLILR